jgi:hypothetical protein
LLLRL